MIFSIVFTSLITAFILAIPSVVVTTVHTARIYAAKLAVSSVTFSIVETSVIGTAEGTTAQVMFSVKLAICVLAEIPAVADMLLVVILAGEICADLSLFLLFSFVIDFITDADHFNAYLSPIIDDVLRVRHTSLSFRRIAAIGNPQIAIRHTRHCLSAH